MATKQPAIGAANKYHWGYKFLDLIRPIMHASRLSVVPNGNNPPTVKAGTSFYVWQTAAFSITTSEATIDVSYPHNQPLTMPQSHYIFESADVTFQWGVGTVPVKSTSTQYYISCAGSDDTAYSKRGQGVYCVDTLPPVEDFEKGGFYNAAARKVIASFYVYADGSVGLLNIYHWTRLAVNAVASSHLQNGAVTNEKLADGSVTAEKLSGTLYPATFPVGSMVMHTGDGIADPVTRTEDVGSRTGDTVSLAGWKVCNGQGGTPDLKERFAIGASATKAAKSTGGSNSTTLTTAQMPPHVHALGANAKARGNGSGSGGTYINAPVVTGEGSLGTILSGTTESAGTGSAYDSTPAYYAVVYLIRVS